MKWAQFKNGLSKGITSSTAHELAQHASKDGILREPVLAARVSVVLGTLFCLISLPVDSKDNKVFELFKLPYNFKLSFRVPFLV